MIEQGTPQKAVHISELRKKSRAGGFGDISSLSANPTPTNKRQFNKSSIRIYLEYKVKLISENKKEKDKEKKTSILRNIKEECYLIVIRDFGRCDSPRFLGVTATNL
jgi:hypothetical protein